MNHQHSASIAKVTLKLANPNPKNATDFFNLWRDAVGIHFLQIELKKKKLLVHYDATVVTLDKLIDGLSQHALLLKGGLFQKWRLDLARQVEQNIQDNLNHVPHCCGKAPTKVKKQ